jgi:hypothetical protein
LNIVEVDYTTDIPKACECILKAFIILVNISTTRETSFNLSIIKISTKSIPTNPIFPPAVIHLSPPTFQLPATKKALCQPFESFNSSPGNFLSRKLFHSPQKQLQKARN